MSSVEADIKTLLEGGNLDTSQDLCDFTLQDQNDVMAAKGLTPGVPPKFEPVLKENVCYIVAAVLIDSEGAVLMMQEAKKECAGQWYLPAGRMEAGETITEAAKREVLEETGLEVEIATLLMVETASGSWYRFVVTGNVTGGTLKTPACADSESLQAKWVSDLNELSLRGDDIFPLIQKGRQFAKAQASLGKEHWHPSLLPVDAPQGKLLMRLIIVIRRRSNNRLCVLQSDKMSTHFPMAEINPFRSLHSTLRKYMTEIFGSDLPPHRPHGVLSLELATTSSGTHGLRLTILVPIKKALEEVPLIDKYTWAELPKALGEDLLQRLEKNMIVPLNVIRVSTLIN